MNDTPADKFMKAMKTKFLTNENWNSARRIPSKYELNLDIKIVNNENQANWNDYKTIGDKNLDFIKAKKIIYKSSSENKNLFRKIRQDYTPVQVSHNVSLINKYGSDEHLTKRWMRTFSSFSLSF